MKNTDSVNIEMTIQADLVSRFYPVLVAGFRVNAQTACSIKELLCRQIGISEDYLETRIQTIFLNGKAIDDVDVPVVLDGSILSLSAAMPGLAGTTLRRGGHLAAMRSQISHYQAEATAKDQKGLVMLKLFNLTTRDLGPFFLAQGIWISGTDFEQVLSSYGQELQRGCRLAKLNDQDVTAQKLWDLDWKNKAIFLVVKVSEN
jgi:hypothetical protein